MATTFDDVIDMALTSIQDYKLNKLYDPNDTSDFETITQGFLLRGLPNFTSCKTSLEYDLNNKTFVNTLSPLEISILADLWVFEWFSWHVNNVTQWEGSMTPSDYKHHSKAENLKQKSEYLDRIREKYSQKMVDYELQTMNWARLANGEF